MKDFALDLNGCSKEDRKKVEKAIRSTGRIKDNNIWYKKGKSEFMSFDNNSVYYLSARYNVNKGKTIYQMPRDWSLIQEDLGIEVEPKYIKHIKGGGNATNHEMCNKYPVWFGDCVGSGKIHKVIKYDKVRMSDNTMDDCCVCENGYVFYIDSVESSTKEAYEAQEVEKKRPLKITLKIGRSGFGESPIKQIFESPYEFSKQYSQNPFHYDVIGLHAENEGLYVRIKELEEQLINGYDGRIMVCTLNKLAVSDDNYKFAHNENYLKEPELGTIEYDLKKQTVIINELNVQLETKDKRIAELEGNLLIMCELGNKVLS